MESPPVRYVRTADGFDIAYAAGGQGSPIVVLPFHHNHVVRRWTGLYWVRGLAKDHFVVHYDSRGQGLSVRGLADDPTPADYGRDLEAVVAATRLESYVLVAYGGFAHVAIRHTLANPDRVRALVLICTSESFTAWPLRALLPLAQENWELFLELESRNFVAELREPFIDFAKAGASQADYIRMVRGFIESDVSDLLPCLKLPALLLHSRNQHWLSPEEGTKFAAKVLGSRLVFLDGEIEPDDVQGVHAMRSFLAELPPLERRRSRPDHLNGHAGDVLSARQIEVLRLLAEGKTNREISEQLVLSERTVERHVADVCSRLSLRNRTEAASYAHETGLV